jgi:TRAP-type C4-dicarboxylate transport system substrate-binding protein
MKSSYRWWVAILAVILILAFVLSGCSSSTSSTTTAPATKSPTAPVSTAAAQKIILKVHIGPPPVDPQATEMVKWADAFNKSAAGRYEMQVYPGDTLVKGTDALDSIRTRVVDMGGISMDAQGKFQPEMTVSYLPFIFNNYEANLEFVKIVHEFFNNMLSTKYNQKLICWFNMGASDIYSKTQIKNMADLKGKLVSCQSNVESKTLQALGASPVSMGLDEEIPSLQKGVIDAGEIGPPLVLMLWKYWEVVKYMVQGNMYGTLLGVSINNDVFNKLPADLQKVMLDQGQTYSEAMWAAQKDSHNTALETITKNGMTVYKLPEDERAKWITSTESVRADYWKSLSPDSSKLLQDAISKANAAYPYKAQ